MFAKILDQGKNFKIAIFAVNLVIAGCFVVYLAVLLSGKDITKKTSGFNNVVASEYTQEVAATQNNNDGMSNIYYTLLNGTHADAGEGKTFYFSSNGIFSGYFDNQRTSVNDYVYEVTELSDGSNCVNIYNPEMTQYVSYQLGFDDESNLIMYYGDNGEYITLK